MLFGSPIILFQKIFWWGKRFLLISLENSIVPDSCIYTSLATRDNTANAGKTITFEGKVHNDCEKELTVKLLPRAKEPPNVIKPEWVTVKPEVATLGAQETVYFHASVTIPKEAGAGFYDGMIAIQSEDGPEQIEDYGVQVYKPLDDPVKKAFRVPEKSSKVIVTVAWSTDETERSAEDMVDVQLYNPKNEQIAQEAKMTHISGYMDAYRYAPFPVPEMPYEKAIDEGNEYVHESHTVIYQIANPENGTWTLVMKPKNVMHFKYDIVVNPIEDLYK